MALRIMSNVSVQCSAVGELVAMSDRESGDDQPQGHNVAGQQAQGEQELAFKSSLTLTIFFCCEGVSHKNSCQLIL